jgi:small GTP-binding protein
MSVKYKVVLLGNATVGKTSIADRLTRGKFNDYTSSTIGAAYSFLKKDDINMDLWDTAGQERYLSLMPMYFRNADVVLLVFDVSDMESIDRLYYYLDKVDKEIGHKHITIVIGNKTDLVDSRTLQQISGQVATQCKKYSDVKHVYVSAKTNYNFDSLVGTIVDSCRDLNKNKDTDENRKKLRLLPDAAPTSYYQEWMSYCNCA